jgi:hypothetical protein
MITLGAMIEAARARCRAFAGVLAEYTPKPTVAIQAGPATVTFTTAPSALDHGAACPLRFRSGR